MAKPITDQERVARFRAFWQRAETDRPLIGTTISTFPSFRAVRRNGLLRPEDLDVAENLRELDEEWEQWRDVSGDALWVATPIWAFPWYLAMAGCPVQRDDAENIWAHPALDDWRQLESIRFDSQNPWFLRLVEFTRALVAHARGRYAVGVGALMLGPCDTMMQVRGQERLALDMHDTPEKVEALGERCVDLCAGVAAALHAIVPPYLGGYAGTSRYFWAPDRMVESAEDISFMVSPRAHRRFILPMHRALGRRFPYQIVHLHSAQLHTVPNLLEADEVTAIEITPDFGEDMRPYIPLMGQILERKPLILHGVMTVEVVKEIRAALPARGLCLFCRCNSPEAAGALLEEVD